MAKIIGMPKLSPTMEEGTLASWAKKEGDAVEVDDLLAEVETDKAMMEFRSFDRGVLLKILAPEGSTLRPDQPVAIIGEKGADIQALLESAEGPPEPAAAPAEAPAQPPAPVTAAVAEKGGGRILASPLVRRIARERDIDLAALRGTGPRGRIVKRDLEGAPLAKAPPAPAPAIARPAPGRQPPLVEKATSMRRTIARRLSESKRDVPHYYLTIDIDAEPLIRTRKQLNELLESSAAPGGAAQKVSLNDLVIKGCAIALRRVPAVNSSWMDDEIHRHQVVDVSVAVAIPDGLITPVVRDADQKGVATIAREVKELAARARAKQLQPEEFTGGTFSVSNLGMYGIDEFVAVINPPEGAILAIGAVRDEPVVRGDAVVPGKRLRMTLSADHRVIDGALGAEFLQVLRGLFESPVSMLL